MIRGTIAGVAVALLGMTVLFGINFAVMRIPPEHYRGVVVEAVDSGTLAAVTHSLFAPGKELSLHGGNDCAIVGALVVPRGPLLEASVSPRMLGWGDFPDLTSAPGYPPAGICLSLAATMKTIAHNPTSDRLLQPSYHHRYIHGDVTVAALLLALMSFGTAATLMLAACGATLAAVALLALKRLRANSAIERRRAAAFLIIAATLALCYAVPLFDRSFSFAPTDFVIFGFILYGMLQPLGRLPRHRFVVAAAAFGTLIAILEILTGGVPMALATLVALVALGEAPDARTLWDRMITGTAAFTAAVVACFGFKLLAVGAVFGTNEIADFFAKLAIRTGPHLMGESLLAGLSDNAKDALNAYRIDPQWIDANFLTRILFAGAMLTYSSFYLGWGSHLLGAAIVLVPTPLLLAFAFASLRDRKASTEAARAPRVGGSRNGSGPVVPAVCEPHHLALFLHGATVGFERRPMHRVGNLAPGRAASFEWRRLTASPRPGLIR